MTRTLLIIFAALAFMIGSFIWFVVTWDPTREQPVSAAPMILVTPLEPPAE